MTRRIWPLIAAAILMTAAVAGAQTFVRLSTDAGDVLLEMKPEVAPGHVANFIHLGANGFYTGTTFHRVIPGFMVQGGDPLSKNDTRADDGTGGPAWSDVLTPAEFAKVEEVRTMLEARGYAGLPAQAAVKAEFNETGHERGVLSMARSQHPDSGGSQFFICVADTRHLDGKYTAFGRVVMGMETVDDIVSADRDRNDNPLQPIRITGFEVVEGLDALTDDERAAREGPAEETAAEDVVAD
jgi:peptidyl-prolyl cis-trans isomerase B (cyclophilin B)